MADKKAALEADRLLDTPLASLSAAQFIDALTRLKVVEEIKYWPEKKKYELELEPVFEKLKLRDFVEVIRNVRVEKKKVEYELPDWWRWRVNPDPTLAELAHRLDQVVQKLDALEGRVGR